MKRFECDVCGKLVENEKALHSMVRFRPSERERGGPIRDHKYPTIEYCDECQRKFTEPVWLDQHNAIYDLMENHVIERLTVREVTVEEGS